MHPKETKVHRRGLTWVPGLAANHEAQPGRVSHRRNVRSIKCEVGVTGHQAQLAIATDPQLSVDCLVLGRPDPQVVLGR
jgi:hypothetical protein